MEQSISFSDFSIELSFPDSAVSVGVLHLAVNELDRQLTPLDVVDEREAIHAERDLFLRRDPRHYLLIAEPHEIAEKARDLLGLLRRELLVGSHAFYHDSLAMIAGPHGP